MSRVMKSIFASLLIGLGLFANAATPPPLVSAAEMSGRDGHLVRVEGTVRDAFADERDADYVYLLIQTATGPIYATTLIQTNTLHDFSRLVNAEVVATGFCRLANNNLQPRRYLGHILALAREIPPAQRLVVTRPAPADPFDVPELDEACTLNPLQIQQLGRRRVRGCVRAVWGRSNALVETPSRQLTRLEFADGSLPAVGAFIEAVGFADTDAYRLNLTRATGRTTAPWDIRHEPVRATSAAAILTDGHGRTLVDTEIYGKAIRLRGTVRALPDGTRGNDALQIDNDGWPVPIDVSACPGILDGLVVGCRVEATGICILNIGNCRPNAAFPQVHGFSLVVRTPADLVVLARPSVWTMRRLAQALAIAFVILAILLVVILVRNRARRILADAKAHERARLSIELHDALSQTLSGIAMQLGAIKRFAQTDSARMFRHLDIAARTLKACRDELRNILFDLRSRVLDEPDLETAVRQVIEPHLCETDVRIRFAVPRSRLSDVSARALLGIIRELVVNAVRHGHATRIRIAGSLEGGRLYCSVADNGHGFDPESAPGAEEGHFGLQGIRERMDAVNGALTIESRPGDGAKVTISMNADECARKGT